MDALDMFGESRQSSKRLSAFFAMVIAFLIVDGFDVSLQRILLSEKFLADVAFETSHVLVNCLDNKQTNKLIY
jgi:hypothetical protein